MNHKSHLLSIFRLGSLLLIALIFSFFEKSYSSTNGSSSWHLYGGVGPAIVHHQTHSNTNSIAPEVAFSSYIIYKFDQYNIGIGVGSFAQYGPKVKKITIISTQGGTASGEGSYTSASIGPRIQYFFNIPLLPDKISSFSLGYLISEQTFKIKNKSEDDAKELPGHKITYEGHGYFCSFSLYDNKMPAKEFPWFGEINFKYLRGKKETIIGGTQYAVKPLFQDNDGRTVREITLMFILGLQFI